jgi:hypothetical protein
MSEEVKKINCRVVSVVDGSKQLIFEVAGTRECVGEVRISSVHAGYLPVMAELIEIWARRQAGGIDTSARDVLRLNGAH